MVQTVATTPFLLFCADLRELESVSLPEETWRRRQDSDSRPPLDWEEVEEEMGEAEVMLLLLLLLLLLLMMMRRAVCVIGHRLCCTPRLHRSHRQKSDAVLVATVVFY